MRATSASVVYALLSLPIAGHAYETMPIGGQAYETTDVITWTDQGLYPAYPKLVPERPFQLFVSGGAYHDSNVFRLSDSVDTQALLGTTSRSDTVGRLGVGLKGELTASRQRLLIDARADRYKYDRFSFLDNTAYRAGATWKWAAGEAWAGDLGYSKKRYLTGFGQLQAPIKDLLTQDNAFFVAKRRLTPEWQVRAGADWTKYEHSDPTLASAESRITSGTIGADHFTSAGNSVGAQVKGSEGRYPNREVVAGSEVDNRYREVEASAVAHWEVSGKSRFDARVGYTRRRHEQIEQRDFSGATGRLDYAWTPSGKTLLDFAAWRELRSIEDTVANYVLSEGAGFGPHWAPTAAIVLQAWVSHERRDYQGDPGFVLTSAPRRVDTLDLARVSIGYNPRRFMRFSLSFEHGKRDSNFPTGDYSYNLASANARFTF